MPDSNGLQLKRRIQQMQFRLVAGTLEPKKAQNRADDGENKQRHEWILVKQ